MLPKSAGCNFPRWADGLSRRGDRPLMSDDASLYAERRVVVRLGEIVMILELHRQGVTVSGIARQVGLDRKTARRCIADGLEPPVYCPRKPRTTQPHPPPPPP